MPVRFTKILRRKMDYTEINSQTIDRWVEEGWEWGKPISHEEYMEAKAGNWSVKLTPIKSVPKEWFPDLKGLKILGLASGGGQQMPVFTAGGGLCTVLDYSKKQLESEALVAEREGYEINIVHADMTKPLPFEDGTFDMIFHPVSNCYVKDVSHVWKECFRVLKPQGILMSGLDNGMNFIVDEKDESKIVEYLPFDPLVNERQMKNLQADDSGVQFSHTLEEQIGGQLRAGFELLDVYEDTNSEGFLMEHGIPAFWATLARKKEE